MVKTVSVCHIQPDFADLIDTEDNGDFYINVDESLDHVKEYRVSTGGHNNLVQIGPKLYSVDLEGKKYKFRAKEGNYADVTQDRWSCIDAIDQPVTQFALGDSDGNIRVFDSTPTLQHDIREAHLDEITCLKFFPSGQVLLSGSTDMRLKIWSLADESNPRTFQGHKSQITDACMVERGRNFVSSSKDGTVKLWETGSGLAVHTFYRRENPLDGINTLALNKSLEVVSPRGSNTLEFGTEGKTVLAGHNSGVITAYDLFNKNQVTQLPGFFMSACNALARVPNDQNYLYAGYSNGALAQWDLRKTDKPVDHVLINEGIPINHIYYHSNALYVSSGVDTAIRLDLQIPEGNINAEAPTFLVANDCQVAQFVATPHNDSIIAVGNWGLCVRFQY
ncbi:hypothetical protein ZYGR_0AY01980 [Zygosaccharomyces rouxii]|uniref:Uncharacterized protein n=1 Tax=Zygosaccharomyces rouxii TaxID=4956 RepID=A0A1Q3AJJ3_ZYGRO|nr:hypothetical protein ZYGR_0AY01980 [Zygosaccharomyces rouxii]